MSKKLQAIRGMHDILPDQTSTWQYVESVFRTVLGSYGYREIRLPIVEKTELFRRSIGEVTDIVEKEMYTFEDRNGDSLTLRPEGTAGCLRACLEHGLLHNQVQRVWYQGPMFRHERPQKGRYRQFFQVGVEAYGMAHPDIDTELILVTNRFWRLLGVSDKLELQINSLGTVEERLEYRKDLVRYLEGVYDRLDEDSRRRLETNPLRILDSKNPALNDVILDAPSLLERLGNESKAHFDAFKIMLDTLGVRYTVNTRLVRGLDYYCGTVFEWVTTELGAQGTVCAGGRYDALVEQLGGKGNSAIGFALGVERLIALLDKTGDQVKQKPVHMFMIRVGTDAERMGIVLTEKLRDEIPELRLSMHCGGGSFKSQFKKADKSGAAYALILGEDETAKHQISLKSLRTDAKQQIIPQSGLTDFCRRNIF